MDREVGRDVQASLAHDKEALALYEDIDRSPKADENGLGLMKKTDVKAGLADVYPGRRDVLPARGRPGPAAPHFRKALAIRRELSSGAPGTLAYRLDVARSQRAIADTSFRLEDRETAVASYDECLGIIEEGCLRRCRKT